MKKQRKKDVKTQTEQGGVEKKSKVRELHDKWSEAWEENRIRAYFVRLFGKYNIRNEEQFSVIAKWLIFSVLILVEILMIIQHAYFYDGKKKWLMLTVVLGLVGVLTLSEALKLFVIKKGKTRIAFYVLDAVTACCFMLVTSGTYPVLIYMIVLTEIYIGLEKTRPSVALLCIGVPVYAASYYVRTYLLGGGEVNLASVGVHAFGALVALLFHYVVVNIALAFYRQFLRLDKALTELDENKKELEKAYASVAEMTALKERQRIAKEIHDTAGHSLTTVIMQTESAKLIVDSDPQEAKNKIAAANLRARHALEELRDCVHLLSGRTGELPLKTALEAVVRESMDGTGIVIRSEIDDTVIGEGTCRFLCNTLKEGISNGLRHGKATAFWFELKKRDGKLCFLLSDNGKGVETADLKEGFGLSTMRERAKALGGEIDFVSEDEEGFEIRMTLPAREE